jgi:cytochrome c-type biogenesis protein CcmH/NrfF
VLPAPTKTGFDRVAWITPYVALLLGLGLVGFIVRAWRSRPLLRPAELPASVQGPELERFREQARRETEV